MAGGCHHRITAPTGEISSPNWPNYYQSRKDCEWYLVTTPGHRVKLAFGFFEMEPHQECAYDHITLYDGNATAAQTLGRFCGSKIPHPIVSSGNRLLVTFHSDASVQRRGFLARHVSGES
ncbi:PREDICTED: tolloid-like protein 1, partial [Priapulus caudatus]|uniref:Tolloid-like protein 1 n=1 Tax=Priapulus caudatus TaxID=37621 RepID=A0ABM1F7R4_PRICU